MKKTLSFLLALFLTLTLCACGGDGETENGGSGSKDEHISSENSGNASAESQDAVTAEPALTVTVAMNAELTMALDSEWNILSMEAGDEGLQSFLTELALTGKSYDEGMVMLLDAAREQKHISGKICFTLPCAEFSFDTMDTLFAPVRAVQNASGEFIAIDWVVIPEEEPDFNADWLYGTQRIKKDGETYYMDRWESAALGSGIKMTVYNTYSKLPDPNIYHGGPIVIGNDLDIIRLKIAYFYENGDWIVTRFADGYQSESVSSREGQCEAYNYEKRVQTLWAYKDPNGSYSFFEYENGIMVRSFGYWTDGTTHSNNLYTYYENGSPATSEDMMSDGSFSRNTYYEDGTRSSYEGFMPDGTHIKETYYEDGTIATSESSGYVAHFNPDGSYQYLLSGDMEYFFEEGKLVKVVVSGIAYTDEETLSAYAAGF